MRINASQGVQSPYNITSRPTQAISEKEMKPPVNESLARPQEKPLEKPPEKPPVRAEKQNDVSEMMQNSQLRRLAVKVKPPEGNAEIPKQEPTRPQPVKNSTLDVAGVDDRGKVEKESAATERREGE